MASTSGFGGGFASAATAGGFAGAASISGGFAAVAAGNGFGSVTSGVGSGGAASGGDGFAAALASGSGFATTVDLRLLGANKVPVVFQLFPVMQEAANKELVVSSPKLFTQTRK